MLDSMSENVLKFIINQQLNCYQGTPIPYFQSHINEIKDVPPIFVRPIIKHLDELGFIKAEMNAQSIKSVSLTHLGATYFKTKAKENRRYWLEHLHFPILITILGSVITFLLK